MREFRAAPSLQGSRALLTTAGVLGYILGGSWVVIAWVRSHSWDIGRKNSGSTCGYNPLFMVLLTPHISPPSHKGCESFGRDALPAPMMLALWFFCICMARFS